MDRVDRRASSDRLSPADSRRDRRFADARRRIALDERVKAYVATDPALRNLMRRGDYLFEVQQSIGDEQAAELRRRGHPTQVYVIYGTQEWLYVCNRLAEDPRRLLQAVIDAAG